MSDPPTSKTNPVSRRGFLGLAAAAAATALTPVKSVRANTAIGLAAIGCGARGIELLRQVAGRNEARVLAVSDVCAPRREAQAAMHGAAAFARWEDAIAHPDVDAVLIAAPDHWHAPMAIAAMQAGKDVYCEGPMALTLDEARAFRDTAATTRRVVQIGAQQTSEGQWYTANRLLRAGVAGRVLWGQGSYSKRLTARATLAPERVRPDQIDWHGFLGNAPKRPFEPDRFFRWRHYWDYSGGVATDLLYPKLAALLVAIGPQPPARVSAAGGVYIQDGREIPDSFVMTVEYPDTGNGAPHTIVLASSVAGNRALPAVIRGDKAALYFDGDAVRVIPEIRGDQRSHDTATIPVEPRHDHMTDWLDAIRTRRTCACNPALAYQAAIPILLAIQAYRERKTLFWDATAERGILSPPDRPLRRTLEA